MAQGLKNFSKKAFGLRVVLVEQGQRSQLLIVTSVGVLLLKEDLEDSYDFFLLF